VRQPAGCARVRNNYQLNNKLIFSLSFCLKAIYKNDSYQIKIAILDSCFRRNDSIGIFTAVIPLHWRTATISAEAEEIKRRGGTLMLKL
jgi:hypothetical protein